MPLAATKIRREHKSVVLVSFIKNTFMKNFRSYTHGYEPLVIGLNRPETVPRVQTSLLF